MAIQKVMSEKSPQHSSVFQNKSHNFTYFSSNLFSNSDFHNLLIKYGYYMYKVNELLIIFQQKYIKNQEGCCQFSRCICIIVIDCPLNNWTSFEIKCKYLRKSDAQFLKFRMTRK